VVVAMGFHSSNKASQRLINNPTPQPIFCFLDDIKSPILAVFGESSSREKLQRISISLGPGSNICFFAFHERR